MKKSIAVFLGLVLVAGAAFAVDQVTDDGAKSYSWRYKMTVTVETPEGDVSGSAVREVNIQKTIIGWSKINQAHHYATEREVSGEAVVIDLGERGKLFSTIDYNSYYDTNNAFGLKKYEDVVALPIGSTSRFKIDEFPHSPTMVTFADTNDPKSVKLVYEYRQVSQGQYEPIDHFKELFGEGVALKDITVEVTKEPVSRGKVDKHLNWLQMYRDKRLRLSGNKGAITNNDLSNNIGTAAFSTGGNK